MYICTDSIALCNIHPAWRQNLHHLSDVHSTSSKGGILTGHLVHGWRTMMLPRLLRWRSLFQVSRCVHPFHHKTNETFEVSMIMPFPSWLELSLAWFETFCIQLISNRYTSPSSNSLPICMPVPTFKSILLILISQLIVWFGLIDIILNGWTKSTTVRKTTVTYFHFVR